MDKVTGWIIRNRKILIIFAIYMTISFVTIFFHERWEDEAQAWLTVRDCTPIELIGRMKAEGHFLPWYLILMPFAKLGLPFIFTNIISWLITSASAWLMLKKLPCKFYKRVIFIFTLPMIYLFPVVSRCYCLIPLATILAIMFYKDRFKKPVPYLLSIILMLNTHIFCLMFALIMGLEYLVDWLKIRKTLSRKKNRKIYIYIIGAVVLAILSILPMLDCMDGSETSAGVTGASKSFIPLHIINGTLADFARLGFWFIPTSLTIVLSGLFLASCLAEKTAVFFKIFFSVLWQVLITEYIFSVMLPSRAVIPIFIILFFVVCSEWRPKKKIPENKKFKKAFIVKIASFIISLILVVKTGFIHYSLLCYIFAILILFPPFLKRHGYKIRNIDRGIMKLASMCLLICSLASGFIATYKEFTEYYSDAPSTAKFISENLEETSVFLVSAHNDTIFTTPIIATLADTSNSDTRFYDLTTQRYYTYSNLGPTAKSETTLAEFLEDFKNRDFNINIPLYYIEPYPARIDVLIQALKESAIEDKKSEANLLAQGVITEVFNSNNIEPDFDFHAYYEYYRIYKVDLTKL